MAPSWWPFSQVKGTVSGASGRNALNPSALSPRQPFCIIVSPHQRATEMFWPLFGDLSCCMLKFQHLVHLDNNVRGTVCPKKKTFLHFLQVCLLSGLMFTYKTDRGKRATVNCPCWQMLRCNLAHNKFNPPLCACVATLSSQAPSCSYSGTAWWSVMNSS